VHTSDGFDANTYKLMKKSSYDFNNPAPTGHVNKAKPCGYQRHRKDDTKLGRQVTDLELTLATYHPNE